MTRKLPPELRWRCRRGMRELDVLLERWLKTAWDEAGPDERAAFGQLLDHDDARLWDWLSGRVEPDNPMLRDIVARILETRG